MPDPQQDLGGLIDSFGVPAADKDRAWTAYHGATDSAGLQQGLDQLSLSPDQKTALWNHWHGTHAAGASTQAVKPTLGNSLKDALTPNVGTPFGDLRQVVDWGKHAIPAAARNTKDAATKWSNNLTAHDVLPTAGAVTGAMVTPEAPVLGAGLGAFGGDLAASGYDAVKGRTPTNVFSSATEAGLAGAGGELIPMFPRMRPLQTEAGQAVEKLYGAKAMPHQMTNSGLLDFLYNIAGGMTGAGRIEATKTAQQEIEAGTVRNLAGKIHPSMGLPSDAAAQHVRQSAGQAFEQAQTPLKKAYEGWLGQFGQMRERTPIPNEPGQFVEGPTVAELHKARSAALERGRDALADGDAKGAYEANKIAEQALTRLKALVGNGAISYDKLGAAYRHVMDTYDNPLMNKIRRGVHPEQLADMLLKPEQSFPKMTAYGERVSQSIPQMMGRVKQALPQDSWQELQAATLQKLYENSVKLRAGNATVGELDAKSMKDAIAKMGAGAFQTLFETNAQPIKEFADAVAAASRRPGQTGKFFIDLRQAAAISLVGGAVAGGVIGSGGNRKEAGEAGALAAAGTYLVAPWALARMMTNPNLRGLFIRGLEEADPTIKQQIMQGLTRLLSQSAAQTAASKVKPAVRDEVPNSGLPKMGDVQIPPAPAAPGQGTPRGR